MAGFDDVLVGFATSRLDICLWYNACKSTGGLTLAGGHVLYKASFRSWTIGGVFNLLGVDLIGYLSPS